MTDSVVSSRMISVLMTAEDICAVLTLPSEEKQLPPPNIPFLHHKQARQVTRGGSHGIVRACGHPGGLAGKTCFQNPATDNYVSNKNKPSLPGMLELKSVAPSLSVGDTELCRSRWLPELLEMRYLHFKSGFLP